MWRISLPDSNESLVLTPRFDGPGDAPYWISGAALLVIIILNGWLFRWEARLVRPFTALVLLSLRVLALSVLWFLACFQPTVVEEYTQTLPGRVVLAVDVSASMDFADPQPAPRDGLPFLSRRQQALHLLHDDGLGLLKRLQEDHDVELYFFADEAKAATPAQLWERLQPKKNRDDKSKKIPTAGGTNLALPLGASVATPGDGAAKLLGIVVVSDGRHNLGDSPESLAKDLGRRKLPIYPIALGTRLPPPDIALEKVGVPGSVLRGADCNVRVHVKISHLPPQDVVLEVFKKSDPKTPIQTKTIAHDGKNQALVESLTLKFDEVGVQALEVKARTTLALPPEITLDNNVLSAVVRVVQDKPRILLVDGESRWEHHYLASALSRDPSVEVEQVLFQPPRLGLIPEDKLEKIGFARRKLPEKKGDDEPLSRFDCILLGDVDPDDLPVAERERLRDYVAVRGGTLVLISGKRFLPLGYGASGDPLGVLLPVTEVTIEKWEKGFHVDLTPQGQATPWLRLEDTAAESSKRWRELPKHYWGLTGKPKPGATVLAKPKHDEPTPPSPPPRARGAAGEGDADRGLIVQHNFGLGRVLWLGIDSTWRWRYLHGDWYHHRFWGQVTLWAASKDLLPAGNVHVRFGSRQPVYIAEQPVDLAVRLGPDVPLPGAKDKPLMRLNRILPDGTEEPAGTLPLKASAAQPRLWEADTRDLPPGRYRVAPDFPLLTDKIKEAEAEKGDATFEILAAPTAELLDPSSDWDLLHTLAEKSHGKLHTPASIDELVETLRQRVPKREERHEARLWQDEPFVWWVLGIVLGLLTLEWAGRKWAGLP